jgi:pyruvate/2-oxoglutarate dehydrogenase complex dihydrolipoamide dehydrogenase (E3) component
MTKYDAIIIGSGQAGNPLAKKLAAAGWRTAVIEKKWVGGTCVNVGCTPTKTLIASGRVAYLAKRSADFGIHTTGISIDIAEVIKRKNELVLSSRESSTKGLLEQENLDLIFGNAAFSGPKEITVVKEDGSRGILTAEKIFINTGTLPVIPTLPGLEKVDYLTSTSIMDLMEVPSHLVIVGGSYIALEFGQLYRRLGSEVTILESSDQFLSKEDTDIAAEIKKILEEDGIRILTGAHATQVAPAEGGIRVDITVNAPTVANSSSGLTASPASGASTDPRVFALTGSHLLVATGREADTKGLNLAAAEIRLNKKGFIDVNDRLETNIPGIYALGDCKGGPQFTHISYNDHLVVYKNLLENGNQSIAGRIAVYCLFTDPELGRIGLTEKEARDKGLNIKVATMPAAHIARAWENGETRGFLKAIVNMDDKKIIGAAALSVAGGEIMSLLQMAMLGGITYDTLRDGIFAHPTFAESLNNLFAGLDKDK